MSVRATYSIGDLAAAAGVSRRTLHFYVQRGLLPPPEGRGRGARYTDEHLARLLRIKGWQEQGVPLEEIRQRVSARDARQASPRPMTGARREPDRPAGTPLAIEARLPAPSAAWEPRDVPGAAWFRQPLGAGFELHVAAGKPQLTARQLALLARALGDILNNRGEEE